MDVKVGDFYEYTGKTGFDLVQNNTYPIINIDKNNNIDGKGIAMVKAPNAEEANQILIANGMYNGSPQDYLITKTEEIVVPPCCGLMAEQTVEFFNNN